MDWLISMMLAVADVVAPPENDPSLVVDLLDVQWWQWLAGALAALGLSPAPWILGLASGKIQFTAVARKDFERQLTEKDTAHERELTARETHHAALMAQEQRRYDEQQQATLKNAAAAEKERERADEVTDALLGMADVVRANQHFMSSSLEAGHQEVNENGT